MGIMTDAAVVDAGTREDATARLRITPAAVARAKKVFNTEGIDEVGEKLGFTRMSWYRLRAGTYDIRISRATALAEAIGWTLDKTFGPVNDRG